MATRVNPGVKARLRVAVVLLVMVRVGVKARLRVMVVLLVMVRVGVVPVVAVMVVLLVMVRVGVVPVVAVMVVLLVMVRAGVVPVVAVMVVLLVMVRAGVVPVVAVMVVLLVMVRAGVVPVVAVMVVLLVMVRAGVVPVAAVMVVLLVMVDVMTASAEAGHAAYAATGGTRRQRPARVAGAGLPEGERHVSPKINRCMSLNSSLTSSRQANKTTRRGTPNIKHERPNELPALRTVTVFVPRHRPLSLGLAQSRRSANLAKRRLQMRWSVNP